jgi:pimeloyl-ACP methyl ester carboxylesterase
MAEFRTANTVLADVTLAGRRWDGEAGRNVVLLHAGVCDLRSWEQLAPELTDLATVWAYDRPGYGATGASRASPPGVRTPGARDHVADAVAFLDAHVAGPAWLIGSSMGGAVALDIALVRPERVSGLVLLAPGISGAPPPTLSPAEQRLEQLMDAAAEAGDIGEVNRYETWFWLDGPEQAEGRVQGAARVLALEMNRTILELEMGGGSSEHSLDQSVDAWNRLVELDLPATVAVGEYDAGFIIERARHAAAAITAAGYVELPATAHLPYLDATEPVLDVIRAGLMLSP